MKNGFFRSDHFKAINDRLGHPAGDAVLCLVATRLSSNLRSDDMVCRWGGEEFLMVFPGVDAGGIRNRVDSLRALVAATPMSTGGAEVEVTLSFGLTSRLPGEGLSSLLSRADSLLYEAKRKGRNRLEDDLGVSGCRIADKVASG